MTEKGGEAWAAGRLSDAPTNWSSNKIIQQTKAGSRVSLARAAAVAAATAAEAVDAAVAAAAALAEAEAVEAAEAAEATEAAEAVEAAEAAEATEAVEAAEAAEAAEAEAEAEEAEATEATPNWLSNVFYSQSRAGATEANAAAAAAQAVLTAQATAAAAAQAVLTAQAEAAAALQAQATAAAEATAAAAAETTAAQTQSNALSTKNTALTTEGIRQTAYNTAVNNYNTANTAYQAALQAYDAAVQNRSPASEIQDRLQTKDSRNAERSHYDGIKNIAYTTWQTAITAREAAQTALNAANTALLNATATNTTKGQALVAATATYTTKTTELTTAIQTKTAADDDLKEAEIAAAVAAEAAKVTATITIVTNNPIYNKYISGYIRGVTGFSIQDTASITFSTGSKAAYFDVQLANIYQNLDFEIVVVNDLAFESFVFGNDYEKDGRVTYTTKTNNVIRAIVTPYEIDGKLETIIAELKITFASELVQTPDDIISQTVNKSVFELVETGLTLCQIELLKKERLNEILNNIENLRNYSRNSGISTNNNNGSLNQAGSRYSENFPSAKFANNVGINELLLTKKNYMFSNSLNKNVISGSIGFNSSNSSPYIAGSSSGLTKVQQYANAAKGRSPSGGVGRRYGVQFFDGRSLVSIPNIYDRFNRSNQTINLCALGNETTN